MRSGKSALQKISAEKVGNGVAPKIIGQVVQDAEKATLSQHLLDWVRENNTLDGQDCPEIDADTNLLETGVLDSVGFIELISILEEKTGQNIDLRSMDFSDSVSINGLFKLLKKLKK